MTADNKRKEN